MKREVIAHLNSKEGEMDRVVLLGPHYLFGNPVNNSYIFLVGNKLCTGIFNWYVCQYYVDDLYGVIRQTDENYNRYKRYIQEA